MKLRNLLNIAYEQYLQIIDSESVRENQLSDYFNANKFIGSNERKIIQEFVFNAIRFHLPLNHTKFKNININGFELIILSLLISNQISGNNFDQLLVSLKKLYKKNDETTNIFSIIEEEFTQNIDYLRETIDGLSLEFDKNELNLKYSFPDEFNELLKRKIPETEIIKIAGSYLIPAKTSLRVNTINSDTEEISKFLLENNFNFTKSEIFPDNLILNQRIGINNTPIYNKGKIEIQDQSSMFVAYAVDPQENEDILDVCAGAGGKSLHMASLSTNSANIYAYDINPNKLKELEKRKLRNNCSSITILSKKELFKKKFDKILIDAPCTGSGTIKRNPALKYKIDKKTVERFTDLQKEIINKYSGLLKNGGKLIYSTCSIIPDENEDIIENFLYKNSEFQPTPLPDNQFMKIIKDNTSSYYTTIYPNKFESDGFFISCITKTNL